MRAFRLLYTRFLRIYFSNVIKCMLITVLYYLMSECRNEYFFKLRTGCVLNGKRVPDQQMINILISLFETLFSI